MGNKLATPRELDPADNTPESRDALDSSSADPTDGQILDDQAILDILEENDTDATSAMKVLAARTMIEEMTEGSTVLHHYQPKAVRMSWMRRIFAWFRRD